MENKNYTTGTGVQLESETAEEFQKRQNKKFDEWADHMTGVKKCERLKKAGVGCIGF